MSRYPRYPGSSRRSQSGQQDSRDYAREEDTTGGLRPPPHTSANMLPQYGQMHLITSLFAALCIHAINLKTADGVGRRLAEHRAQICLLGLKEVQKFWRINNTVLDLFLQYLDESIARRLRGDDVGQDDRLSAIALSAAVSRSSNSPNLPTEANLSQPETNSFEDHYFNFMSTNWEGEKAIDDLGFILDPQFQTHTPEGGPAQVDGLNLLERWL